MFSNGRLRVDLAFSWLFATAMLLFLGGVASQWFGARQDATTASRTAQPRVPAPASLPVRQVSVAGDGETLLVAHGRPYRPLEYRLYDLESLETVRVLPANPEAWMSDASCVSAAVLCGPGHDVVLAAGQRDGTVVVLKNGLRTVHKLHEEQVLAVACASGGRMAASADGVLHVWNTRTGRLLKTIESPDTIRDLMFSADNVYLAATTYEDALLVWDWKHDRLLLRGHAPHLVTAAFSADGRRLLTGHVYGDLRLWSVAAGGQLWHSAEPRAGTIQAVQFLPDDRSFVCANVLGELEVWSHGARISSAMLSARMSGNLSLAVSHDGGRVYVGSSDGVVDVWDVDPLRETGLIERGAAHGT